MKESEDQLFKEKHNLGADVELIYSGDYEADDWTPVGHSDHDEGFIFDDTPINTRFYIENRYDGLKPILDDDLDEDDIELDDDETLVDGCYIVTKDELIGFYTYEHGLTEVGCG